MLYSNAMVILTVRLPRNRCLGARLAIAKPREAGQEVPADLQRGPSKPQSHRGLSKKKAKKGQTKPLCYMESRT